MKNKKEIETLRLHEPAQSVQLKVACGVTVPQIKEALRRAGIACGTENEEMMKMPNLFEEWHSDHICVAKMIREGKRKLSIASEYFQRGRMEAAMNILSQAHATALAAAWLRCELKGEFKEGRKEAARNAKARKK